VDSQVEPQAMCAGGCVRERLRLVVAECKVEAGLSKSRRAISWADAVADPICVVCGLKEAGPGG
jgi:hypothetical protein